MAKSPGHMINWRHNYRTLNCDTHKLANGRDWQLLHDIHGLIPIKGTMSSPRLPFILLSFFIFIKVHGNFSIVHVGSSCLLPCLTAQPIHWQLPSASVIPQHFKAASRSPLWEGTFTVRSKTVRSPEAGTQWQVSQFDDNTTTLQPPE